MARTDNLLLVVNGVVLQLRSTVRTGRGRPATSWTTVRADIVPYTIRILCRFRRWRCPLLLHIDLLLSSLGRIDRVLDLLLGIGVVRSIVLQLSSTIFTRTRRSGSTFTAIRADIVPYTFSILCWLRCRRWRRLIVHRRLLNVGCAHIIRHIRALTVVATGYQSY